MLFSPSTKFFYSTKINSIIPDDVIQISQQEYSLLMEGVSNGASLDLGHNGKVILTQQSDNLDKTASERGWRNLELLRSDIELFKVQDADPKSACSVSDWRAYRKLLRGWPEHGDFPNKEFRPTAPDFKE